MNLPKPHVLRMLVELEELTNKIKKLEVFVEDGDRGGVFNGLTPHEQNLLRRQLAAMKEYEQCLLWRIKIL